MLRFYVFPEHEASEIFWLALSRRRRYDRHLVEAILSPKPKKKEEAVEYLVHEKYKNLVRGFTNRNIIGNFVNKTPLNDVLNEKINSTAMFNKIFSEEEQKEIENFWNEPYDSKTNSPRRYI